ncbi:Eco57I restriction-modification methylase domain-containing protein, partial [Prevotella disiens]|uniref:Eco57I restriction-modification methylase domain-containing protein n=1 Tax=Prevotella disiens TaxID=28130 RepID=UPI00242CB585
MSDYQILNRFTAENIQKATVGLLHYLGIATDLITEKQVAITDLVEQPTKAVLEICRKIHESYLVCSISDRTFSDEEQDETLDEVKENIGKYDQMLVFAVDLHKDTKLCRTEMATLTRALNRASKAAPVVVVFRYYDDGEVRFALSLCERTAYLQAGHTGEKVGRVNILRGINPQKTHAGHIRILEDMRLEKKDKSFEGVYQKWLGVFDNDVLTNKFYEELQNWYFWALKPECRVSFPNDVESDSDDDKYNPQNIIRLITRLIFVWFLRQKGLVPKELFKRDSLARLLKNFTPEDLDSSTYYRAVLQNLFFATLNKKIKEREFMSDEFIMNRNKGKHDVKTFMRHASDLQVSKEEFIELLHPVPFMNNSLFECLDNKEQNGHVYNWDGFSDSNKPQKQAFVPNYLFFAKDVCIDLSEEYGKATASSVKVSGIINILSKYTFTVEENTPLDVDVALDPELLGKVFENLLAAYNPETKETVRKSTGSYYTPRPIVQYMVDESLIAYLKKQVDGVSEDTLRSLLRYTDDDAANPLDRKQTRRLVDAIFRCKVLDPACGSGAFPMGMLQQMAHLLSRVDSDNSIWEEVVIDNAIRYENTIDTMSNKEKAERQAEREKVFALSVDYPDYARKLYLIENCIYGVDLQSIAVQISRLRFFISLVCEQQPTDDATDNYGIHPLPNLEMKFVCANTLVKLENISETRELFANDEIIKLIQELKGVRHELFVVTNSHVKKRLLEKDKTIRDKIMLSTGDCYTRDTEEKIARHEAGLAECTKEMRIAERMSDEVITQAVTQDLFGEKEEVISYSPKQNKIKDINQRISYIKREIKRLQDSLNNGRDKAMRLAKQLTDWNPYDQNLSSPFFDADWMFGVTDGFDVVIGNPPYIQLQSNGGELAALYEEANYKSFARTGDIYCLFYEHGWEMLSEGGSLCFITSNKWMRAGYGEKLRAFLSENTNPELLIDFSGLKIFESATVDVNILLFSRQQNKGQTICAVTAKQPRCCIENLSLFVQQQ